MNELIHIFLRTGTKEFCLLTAPNAFPYLKSSAFLRLSCSLWYLTSLESVFQAMRMYAVQRMASNKRSRLECEPENGVYVFNEDWIIDSNHYYLIMLEHHNMIENPTNEGCRTCLYNATRSFDL